MSEDIIIKLYSIFDKKTNTYCPIISDSIDLIKIDLCNLYLSNNDLHLFEDRKLYQIGTFNTSTGLTDVYLEFLFNLVDIPKLDIFEAIKEISSNLTDDQLEDIKEVSSDDI